MNVLFLTDGIYPFQLGGMQKHSLILSRLLAENQIHVHVVHCGGENYSPKAFLDLYSEESRSYVRETFIRFPKTDPFPGHYVRENKVYSKNIFLELEDQLSEFDLIYAQGFTGWRFIKEKHKKTFDIPVAVNFHGFEMFQTAASIKVKAAYTLLRNSVKWNIRNADYVYSFGGKIDDILISLGVDGDKILLHSNGIEEHWINNPNSVGNTRKFVFIGRAERRKGIEELNKALQTLLLDKDLAFEFDFIGPVPDNLKLNDERLNYHGEVRDQEVIKNVLNTADCLVCPSHAEGMPTVILEAMASGLAVIATNVGASERQVSENGILLEKPDVEALKNALVDMINLDENIFLQMKEKSVQLIQEQFLWRKVVEQKISDFNRMLESSKDSETTIESIN